MKIALSNTNKTSYPLPAGQINGGLWVTGILADGLVKKGYNVDFYTCEDSKTLAHKVTRGFDSMVCQGKNNSPEFPDFDIRFYEGLLLAEMVKNANQGIYDLINVHNTFPLVSTYIPFINKTPTIATLHDPVSSLHRIWAEKFQKDNHQFICISDFQKEKAAAAGLNILGRVYNGIEIEKFKFNNSPKDFIAFLGRIDSDKGPDVAVEFGKQSGMSVKIAGRIKREKNPKLADLVMQYKGGKENIEYVGHIEHEFVGDFLRDAKALIFPTQIDEPFGLSMVEAMACGTPVIAFRRGAVPELVKEGITGFIVEPGDIDGMVQAVKKIDQIDRRECRRWVEENFTIEKMVDNYEKVYQKIVS